jgi:hypothetical protein
MRLTIDPPTLRDNLLEFLRASGCLALTEGSNAIETQLLNSVSDRHDRAVLTGLVESWRAQHPRGAGRRGLELGHGRYSRDRFPRSDPWAAPVESPADAKASVLTVLPSPAAKRRVFGLPASPRTHDLPANSRRSSLRTLRETTKASLPGWALTPSSASVPS